MSTEGFVYLVGAGPGDPRLLTLRAYELLRTASIVAHDELVSDAILALAPADAERIAVGRRHGDGPVEYRLHPTVLDRARAGAHVVRLKCGDPLVFGRGGEEAEELAESGIRFEIVPGISAALGAASYAGIPLTHRACASAVTLATGHGVDEARRPTVVLYMAGRRLSTNVARLVADGWPSSTPAAYVASASTRDQIVVCAPLGELADRVSHVPQDAPAVVIVGDVVTRRRLEEPPLRGRRVLVARARPGRSRIAMQLRALGAEVIEAPDIATRAHGDVELVDHDAIVFSCATGVEALASRVPHRAIISVGEEAAAALARAGIEPVLAIGGACRNAVEAHAAVLDGKRILLVTSDEGRPNLRTELARAGAIVTLAPAYRTIPRAVDIARLPFDLVILPSSSAARAVLASDAGPTLREALMVAMGPATEAEARKHGAHRIVRAATDTIPALVATALTSLGAS